MRERAVFLFHIGSFYQFIATRLEAFLPHPSSLSLSLFTLFKVWTFKQVSLTFVRQKKPAGFSLSLSLSRPFSPIFLSFLSFFLNFYVSSSVRNTVRAFISATDLPKRRTPILLFCPVRLPLCGSKRGRHTGLTDRWPISLRSGCHVTDGFSNRASYRFVM